MGCILNDPVGLIIKYCVFCKRNSQHLSNCCGWFTVTSSSRLPIYATASRGARQFPLVRQSLIGETEGIVGDGQDPIPCARCRCGGGHAQAHGTLGSPICLSVRGLYLGSSRGIS